MFKFLNLLVVITLAACTNYLKDPQEIVDETIKAAGGNRYLNSVIEFDVHNKHYIAKRHGDIFSIEQIFKDSVGTIRDVVSNKGHIREINGMMEVLSDSLSAIHTASINSIINLALLPFGWNDSGVGKNYLGDTMIENEIFYKVEITRTKGGTDSQEVSRYWINRKDFSIGYAASPSFKENDSTLLFCKAINHRKINDIQFYDYLTYKSKDATIKMEELELLFSKGELEELNKIEFQNIVVQ
jgi:hypothetical protein